MGVLIARQLIMAMRDTLNSGLSEVFLSAAIAMLVAVVLVFFLKEIPLRTTMHKEPENADRS